MATITHKHSRGATDPDLLFQCKYTDGTIQILTGATVAFVYAPSDHGGQPSPGATRTTVAMVVADAANGRASLPWASPLIDTARFYAAQVHVTIGSELLIFPEPGTYINLEIADSLAPTA